MVSSTSRPVIGVPTQNLQSIGGVSPDIPPSWVMSHRYVDSLTTLGATPWLIPLVDDALMRARGNNTAMLRSCLERLVPPRREAPVWLKVPPIEDRAGARAALKAVATGVAQGDIPPAQGLKLVRIYTELMRWL